MNSGLLNGNECFIKAGGGDPTTHSASPISEKDKN
jgi:hypothetical protein